MTTQRKNRQRKNRRNSQRGGGPLDFLTNAFGLGPKPTEVPPAKVDEVKLTEVPPATAKVDEVKLTEGVTGTKVDESGIELVTQKKTNGGKSKKNKSNKKRRSNKKKSNKKR